MVDKTTPRLGLPVPYLTNPLKIDVGKLTDALTMLDKNAVMLTDWDITSDSWQKMGKISNLAQGKIAITLMVVTGTGFANIVMQTGDGSVTTVGDPARITVTAQTNLGVNSATILGGKLVEVAADTYEIWFNIAPSTAPRKWTGLLIAGNGATIDWTHSSGAQPTGGVALNIARSLTDQEIASPTITSDGAVLTAAYAGLMGIKLPYFDFAATGDTITSHVWRVGETMRVKAADATTANGFPAGITGAGATGWRIHCEGINEDRTSTVFTFGSEGATPTWLYRVTRSGNSWSTPRRMYASDNPPAASEVKAIAQLDVITTVINLNDRILPAHYGVVSLTSVAGAVAANNFPFDETGQLIVFPIGVSGGVTQIYIAKSGRIASRSYDGSVFTDWRKSAKSGVNDDITSMTGLSGPLKLGGDAVGDYDAVTMRQLRSASGGAGGASMNGVMNYGVGDFHLRDSRAFIQPYEVVSDGQLLNRADWPELWAYAQMLTPISDAEWLADHTKRGRYSLGNGSTTFRVPDRNGVQSNSIKALFARGDGGNSGMDGLVYKAAVPNIKGSVKIAGGEGGLDGGERSLTTYNGANGSVYTPSGTGSSSNRLSLDASISDSVYGRDNITDDVLPRSFVGVWVIRASGGFVAANTSWSVINGDTALPSNNTALKGGDLRSVYQINGVNHMAVTLRAAGVVGGNYAPEIEQVSPSGGSAITKKWTLPQAQGELVSKAEAGYTSIDGKTSGTVNGVLFLLQGKNDYVGVTSRNDAGDPTGAYFNGHMHGYARGGLEVVNQRDGRYGYFLNLTFSRSNGTSTDHRESGLRINADGSTWMVAQPSFGSDIHLKSNITPLGKARDNLRSLRTVTFKMDGLDQMGLIAQDVEPHWPIAVSSFEKEHYENGKLVSDGTFLSLNYTSMIAPAIKGINENSDILDAVVSALESALSDPEEAKKKLTALRKKFY
jgi:hypothetical protein